MIDFTHDELNLLAIYDTGTRESTMDVLTAMREYLESDEQELRDMTDAVLDKLERMTDAEYERLDLIPDFDE